MRKIEFIEHNNHRKTQMKMKEKETMRNILEQTDKGIKKKAINQIKNAM